MSDLRELYQEVILDHYRQPRKRGTLEDASHEARGHNPLCGDRIHVFLHVDDETLDTVRFDGAGCAISMASASLMAEAVEGKTIEEARALTSRFIDMVSARNGEEGEPEALGKLSVLAGVREYPVRIKCASLAWHALRAALAQQDTCSKDTASKDTALVSTE